jgi:hypothetical protein
MFTVEVLQSIGKPPIRLEASQVVIRLPDGTPISLAALYGSRESVLVSHCEDASFSDNLRKLGLNDIVVSEQLKVT